MVYMNIEQGEFDLRLQSTMHANEDRPLYLLKHNNGFIIGHFASRGRVEMIAVNGEVFKKEVDRKP